METVLSMDATRRACRAVATLTLAGLWLLFAYRHLGRFLETGEAALLLFCLSETLQAALFVVRRQPVAVSSQPGDWAVAICGTFGPFLFVPGPASGAAAVGSALVTAGVALQVLGLLSLNRSFGIVPARRRIKTSGMYRLVRHPMYASYFVLLTGYVVSHPGYWNLAVAGGTLACLVGRMRREERVLVEDEQYRTYMSRVRYRVLPFVY